MHHRVSPHSIPPLPPGEELEFGEHGEANDLGAHLLYEVDRGPAGSAGRQHVIDDENPVTGNNRVGVDFDAVGAVLEVVFLVVDVVGQLAGLADGNKPGIEANAITEAKMKPRASIPTTLVMPSSTNGPPWRRPRRRGRPDRPARA